ncbi:MAG: hypothetical protein ACXADX_11540 [Candidatus Hodarchaeales archaeon]|jgi:hypothetical protein
MMLQETMQLPRPGGQKETGTWESGAFAAAMKKTYTRIGMGKVALANALAGNPLFTPEEIALLVSALVPTTASIAPNP